MRWCVWCLQHGKVISMTWIDTTCNDRLRKLIDEDWICHFDPDFKAAHNSLCIMMDRVDDSSQWLNMHGDFPNSEAEFLLFLVHGDIVCKTVLKAVRKLKLNNPYGDKKSAVARNYLSNHCSDLFSRGVVSNIPDDATIWSYLRALAFAHTEETGDKRYYGSLLEEGEKQYSPFVKVDRYRKEVGVVIYSSISDNAKALMLPYDSLKQFVLSRVDLIREIVKTAEKRIKTRNKMLMQEPIDESQGAIETLRILRNKYSERFGATYAYDFDIALMCMETEVTFPCNQQKVMEFRRALENIVPKVVSAFKRLDYEKCFKMLDEVCCHFPNYVSNTSNYNLQKVFAHLKCNDMKYSLAKQCARDLSEDFSAKCVKIDVDAMSDSEIKFLLTVASFFHRKNNRSEENEDI